MNPLATSSDWDAQRVALEAWLRNAAEALLTHTGAPFVSVPLLSGGQVTALRAQNQEKRDE